MYKKYVNHSEIEELQKTLHSISPNLRLSRFSLAPGEEKPRATAAGLYIMEKGNKHIIEKLLSMGFRKMHRERTRNGYADMYDGYSFVLILEKPL